MASTPYATTDSMVQVITPSPVLGVSITDTVGFFGSNGTTKQTVSGVHSDPVMPSLCTALAAYGLIVNSIT